MRDGTSIPSCRPASKLASGSNQPQPFERGLQSALAARDNATDPIGSQADSGLIDLNQFYDAALRHIFQGIAERKVLSTSDIPNKVRASSQRPVRLFV
jgi:hypothetical protein